MPIQISIAANYDHSSIDLVLISSRTISLLVSSAEELAENPYAIWQRIDEGSTP